MRENKLKRCIRNGDYALGTFVKMTDASIPEILALAGFDFFVLDTEHVAVDREQLVNIVRAADAADITPIVRVRENNQVEILQNLDLGYAGVQVPNVDTYDEAKALVERVKYTPLGVRGLSPSVRACNYATTPVKEYIEQANENTMVVSHCETKTCVENLDEILTIDGLDVVFIGPMDLSQSYGIPGEASNPVIQAAIDTVIHKTLNAGKAVGTVAGSPEAAKALIARGVQYILMASDQGMIMKWGKNAVSAVRD